MRIGLPASFFLHGGLLAWALISLERTKPFKMPDPEPVEIAIISEDGLTRLRQGNRTSKQLETAPAKPAPPSQAAKETPKAKPPEPSPPPPPEPAKLEPPPPKPAEPNPPGRDEIAELALKAEQEALAEAQRKAAEEKKRLDAANKVADEKKRQEALKKKQDAAKKAADEKKRQELAKQSKDDFFEDMQKALKDNDPRKRAPQPSGGPQVAQANLPKGPAAGAPEGRDTRLTASEANLLGSMMKKQVTRCWNINSGADGADKIRIEIEVRLGADGRITGQPKIVSRGTGPLYSDMANSAQRALIQCEPYDLPKHLYKGGWDHMIVEFDPSRMY